MDGFYWLIEGELAGCGRPGVEQPGIRRRPPSDPSEAAALLERHLLWLRTQGVSSLLTLTETPLPEVDLINDHFEVHHLPVDDLHAPAPDQFMQALSFIDLQRSQGRTVAVHCLVGQGRTGTILAAYRIRSGLSVEQALEELRRLSPGAIGAQEQVEALHRFAARQDWIL